MGYRVVANTVAEWDDAAPLVFTLSDIIEDPHVGHSATILIDLTDLRVGFTEEFLLHFKDLLVDWRNRLSLVSVQGYGETLVSLFRKLIALDLFQAKVAVVDHMFLLVLDATKDQFRETHLKQLKNAFAFAPYSPIWAHELHASDFPLALNKKGPHGRRISHILAKALTRAACVNILSRCERFYDLGEMDIGHFAFVNLAFAVYCRPESYRQIQLHDLVFDEKTHTHFLYIMPVKTGVQSPNKIAYRINEPLALLLQKQRHNVVARYGHLVCPQDISKLALFPSRKLNSEKSAWCHPYANKHFGIYGRSFLFAGAYAGEIKRKFLMPGCSIGANVLRHTVGTQLAQTGASALTIQAVLKHASDTTCRAYVDIAFHGLIDTLSDSMQPAFEAHMPVFTRFRSSHDPVDAEQAIRSDDPITGKIELTGECGKKIQCEFAPITCYGCVRFIPCWDADHGVNLTIVQREIEDYKRRGLPFRHMVEKAQAAKYHIVLVMNAADQFRQNITNIPSRG